jgi:hypothetical protein
LCRSRFLRVSEFQERFRTRSIEADGDLDAGAAFIDHALVLNPNLAPAWLASGWVRVYLGEPEVATDT